MTNRELLRLFPNASADVIAANAAAQDSGADSKLERHSANEPLAEKPVQKEDSGRLHIRIVSVRKRLCDEDNLCSKFHTDSLRYCRAIPGDEPGKVSIQTTQRKAAKGEEEHTLIELYQEVQTTMPT